MLILFLTFALNSKFLYSGSNLSRFDICECGDVNVGGLISQGEFIKDVEILENFSFKMNVGNLIKKSDFDKFNIAVSLLDLQGYELLLLGPNEAEMLPEDIFSESLKHNNVEIVMSTSVVQDIPRYKILNWDGNDVLIFSLMDPIEINPGWGYIQPEEVLRDIFLETQGMYDFAIAVSWLDTFRNRDLLDAWPQMIDFLIEAPYDFEGIELTFEDVPIVGLSHCANLQLVSFEESLDYLYEKKWKKSVIDIGEGYSFEDLKDSYKDFLMLSEKKQKKENQISSIFPLDFIEVNEGYFLVLSPGEKEIGSLFKDDDSWFWNVSFSEELIVSDEYKEKEEAIDDLKVFLIKKWINSNR